MTKLTEMLKKEYVDLDLPVRQAVVVPSTREKSKPISLAEQKRRAEAVKKYLAKTFGGYTGLKGQGGYVSDDGKLIEENVLKVESFTDRKTFKNNQAKLMRQMETWRRKWGQESMGYELEDDFKTIRKRR